MIARVPHSISKTDTVVDLHDGDEQLAFPLCSDCNDTGLTEALADAPPIPTLLLMMLLLIVPPLVKPPLPLTCGVLTDGAPLLQSAGVLVKLMFV